MPGPRLRKITATWITPCSGDLWEKLEGLKRGPSKEGDLLLLGPTLPDGEDDRIASVVVHRHEPDDELHWALDVGPAPAGDPPPAVKEQDAKLRGRKGLSSLLAEPFVQGVPAVGSFHTRYTISESELRCTVIPAAVARGGGHEAALRLGSARLEQVGYRFDSGPSGIEEVAIIYQHLEREYSLHLVAKGPLKLGSPRWLPFAEDIVDIAVSTFFAPPGGILP